MMEQEILRCFWLPKRYYNDCASGANMFTIKKCGGGSIAEENSDNIIIAEILKTATKYNPTGKYLKRNKELGEGFVQIVNDALKEIYTGGTGCVFSKLQAVTVCSHLSDPVVTICDGCYHIIQN